MAIVTTDGLIDNPPASTSIQAAQWAIATGTADVIAGAYAIPNTSLPDGLLLGFRALLANATTTPTFSPDGLPAHPITKRGGATVAIGDIPGNYAEMLVRYNLANTRWEMLNPSVSTLPTSDWASGVGTGDVVTASFTPSHGSVTPDGTIVAVRWPATNVTTTPTLSVDGSTAVVVQRGFAVSVVPGDLINGNTYFLQWWAPQSQWQLLNPSQNIVNPVWGVAGGTSDALTLTVPVTLYPNGLGLQDGNLIAFRATATNATTTPTLNPNSLGANTIVRAAGRITCVPGDILLNGEYICCYNLANTQWVLLNPSGSDTPFVVFGGTAQSQTATNPNISTLYDGLQINARCTTANTGAAPTLAINGGTAYNIVKRSATALAAGDMAAGAEYMLRFNLANTRWVLLNPVVN